MALALRRLEGTPFRATAGSALRKLVAAMQGYDAAAARDLAGRIHLLGDPGTTPSMPRVVADALSTLLPARAAAMIPARVSPRCAGTKPTGGRRNGDPLVPDGLVPVARHAARVPHRPDHLGFFCPPPRCPRHARCEARTSTSRPAKSIN